LGAQRKRTIARTIRITQELDDLLRKDAKDKNTSVNALAYSILTKYAEWDRFFEKLRFITMAEEVFRHILEVVEEEDLIKISSELGARLPKEIAVFMFKQIDPKTLLEFFSLYAKYSGLYKCEVEAKGEEYTVIYHHDLGMAWSCFLKHFIEEAIKTVGGIAPKSELTENEVIIRFQAS